MNLSIVGQLASQQEAIEADFGGQLEWLRMEEARSCKVVANVPSIPGWRDEFDERTDDLTELASTMRRFERAVAPRIAALDLTVTAA